MLPQRIMDKLDVGLCWTWTGAHSEDRPHVKWGGKVQLVYRVVWELLVGPLPEGITLDHLCLNPSCVNPDHLEPVTMAENRRRAHTHNRNRTHCKRGHEFTEDNTRTHGGSRQCKTCKSDYDRERYAAKSRA